MNIQTSQEIARMAEQTAVNLKQLERCLQTVRNDLASLAQGVGSPAAAQYALTPVEALQARGALAPATGQIQGAVQAFHPPTQGTFGFQSVGHQFQAPHAAGIGQDPYAQGQDPYAQASGPAAYPPGPYGQTAPLQAGAQAPWAQHALQQQAQQALQQQAIQQALVQQAAQQAQQQQAAQQAQQQQAAQQALQQQAVQQTSQQQAQPSNIPFAAVPWSQVTQQQGPLAASANVPIQAFGSSPVTADPFQQAVQAQQQATPVQMVHQNPAATQMAPFQNVARPWLVQ